MLIFTEEKELKQIKTIISDNSLNKKKFYEKIIQIKRVTKAIKGGKKMTFQAIVIIGDKKQKVGVGIGKGNEVNQAIDKAITYGKKHLITVPLTLNASLSHMIKLSYGASTIFLRPTLGGTGIIAGGSVRTVLELAGLKNVIAKQFGSKNRLNNAKVTIYALKLLNERVIINTKQSYKRYKFYSQLIK